jgi:translation initiation factor 2 beta subunit (eIF-2beta)/eIF-5
MPQQIIVCKRCGSLLTEPAERDHSEWILPCFRCGAKNILAVVMVGSATGPLLEIAGVRD